MIDVELVTRKLVLILADMDTLRGIASGDRDTYLSRRIEQAATERYLERLIGRMIDVNYHLLVESGQPPPADYYTSFIRLADAGILDREFATRIAASAGLRHRIIHEYDEIDPAKVFDALQSAVQDVPHYVERINVVLGKQG